MNGAAALILANSNTKKSLQGAGAIKGDPGVGISNIKNDNGDIIITLTDGTIQNVGSLPQGGGRTETILASGMYLKNDTVLLSEDYDKFDELVFITKNTNPDGFITNYIIKKSTTDYAVADDLKLELYGYDNCFITLKFLDSRTISVIDGVGTVLQVSGIKFVSGEADYEIGGGRTKQTLYTNSTTSAQSIELSDSYKNYDLLMFRMIRIADGFDNFQEEKYFDKDWLEQCQNSNSLIQFFGYTQWNTYQVTDETHLTLTNKADGVYVSEVVGIKYSAADGGAGGTLSKDITSNVEVGGVGSGKTFAQGTKLEDILQNILVKYLAPTVSLSISPATTVYKKGSSIASVTMTANVTKKSNPIASVEFYVGGVLVDTQTGATGGTFTYTHTTAITADTTFKVIVRDGTSSPEARKSVVFVNPYYYGASASATVTDTTGLSELVETKGNKTKAYTLSNEYAVFMYPASYGNLKSILDPNNFENLADFNKSTVTIGSVSYNVYVSNNPITCTNFNYTFKY